jgi:hypothetical protein
MSTIYYIVYQGPIYFIVTIGDFEKGSAAILGERCTIPVCLSYRVCRGFSIFPCQHSIAEAFQSFHVSAPFNNKKNNHPVASAKYGASKMELFQACFSREYLLMKRNLFVYIFKLMQVSCYSQVIT